MTRLDRSEAALRRDGESEAREQSAIDREVAASARAWSATHGDASAAVMLANTAQALQDQLVETAVELSEALDRVAEHHDRLSRDDPDNTDRAEHQRQAASARATAALARTTVRQFSD